MRNMIVPFFTFFAGIAVGMLAHPVKFDIAVQALEKENRALRELATLQQQQLDEINQVLK